MIARFDSYTPKSHHPSTGVKLLYPDERRRHGTQVAWVGTNKVDGKQLTRKTFAAGKHREVAI